MFQCNLFNLLTDLMPTPQPKTRPPVVTQPTPTTPPALTHPIPTKSPPTTGRNEYFFARGPLSLFHLSWLIWWCATYKIESKESSKCYVGANRKINWRLRRYPNNKEQDLTEQCHSSRLPLSQPWFPCLWDLPRITVYANLRSGPIWAVLIHSL